MRRGISTALARLQTALRRGLARVETGLDAERDQLVLWIPVGIGSGIALWFVLPDARGWLAVMATGAAFVLGSVTVGGTRRLSRVIAAAGITVALGCGLVWWRSATVSAPVIGRVTIVEIVARIERVEVRTQKDQFRLLLRPDAGAGAVANFSAELPPLVRVTVKRENIARRPVAGERIKMRVRLLPPPGAMIPGGYDFARTAWFVGIGATGSALGQVILLDSTQSTAPSLRERLSAHVRAQLDGSEGGIAAAFASGDRGGIAGEDEDAMRASGLTHLLSISGLHITAVVGATLFVVLRLLSLSPWLALRIRLPVVAAAAGAIAGIGYTLLTGAEVPTVRSCIAAVLVMMAIAFGRDALTLRLVAAGAVFVLVLWPESLIGPSFQLSFAAIASIVALNEHPRVQALTMRREEGWAVALGRMLLSLLITGIAVEMALAPIALYHFHQTGLYGAIANIVAIPLTTFIIMPIEALALLFDLFWAGAPLWWLTGQALSLLLSLARFVAALPGAVAALASVPTIAFALFVSGGMWLILLKTQVRVWGFVPVVASLIIVIATPRVDLMITGDGKHLVIRADNGTLAILRNRAGDYVRDVIGEALGTLAPLTDLDATRGARCGRDMCVVIIRRGGRLWRIAATRSPYQLPRAQLLATCATADIVVSDRRLPSACRPRWIKADASLLRQTGGLAIELANQRVTSVNRPGDNHPWVQSPVKPLSGYKPFNRPRRQYRRSNPASLP